MGKTLRWLWLGVMVLAAVSCEDDPTSGEGDAGEAGETSAGSPSQGGSPTTAGSSAAGDEGGGMVGAAGHAAGGTGGLEQGGAAGEGGTGGDGGVTAVGGQGGAGADDAIWLDDCHGIDLSADGKTVLATRGIWSAETGWRTLSDLPGGDSTVIPRALSRDGRVVFGNSSSGLGLEMTRWVDEVATGMNTLVQPLATNGDGSFAIGMSPAEDLGGQGWDFDVVRWSEEDGLLVLDSFWDALDGGFVSPAIIQFFAASAGSSGFISVRGTETFSFDGESVTRISLGANIYLSRSVDALSPNGGVVATRKGFGNTEPVQIQSTTDFSVLAQPLCAVEPDEYDPKCSLVRQIMTGFDETGQLGVGYESAAAASDIFFHWTPGAAAIELSEFLQEQGVTLALPIGTPQMARLSSDGHTILGSLSTESGDRCFLATF